MNGLLDHHAELLRASAISDDVAAERGYWSAERPGELVQVFGREQRKLVPALVIPTFDVHGEVCFSQLRPDRPRVVKGRSRKYEMPYGARMALDVPPAVRGVLGDPTVPLLFTEGARKADAAVSAGLCAVDLVGVWTWRGRNGDGGLTALADFELIALNGRLAYPAFDSDAMQKVEVHRALVRFSAFLRSRGAELRFIYLPSGELGVKTGLDDYLAAGHDRDDVLGLAVDELRPLAGGARAGAGAATGSSGSTGGDRSDFRERLGRTDDRMKHGGDLTRPVIEAMRVYQHIEDVGHVQIVLGTAVTALLAGDPLWMMVVGGPSSGKTEDLRSLDGMARSVDEVTRAGLLGWIGTPTKGRVGGLLPKIGASGLATIADFSTLLAGERNERERTYAALRRIYDGRYMRNLGQIPEPLMWEGRLTLIAAVTGVVDSYSSHGDALGPRWVYCRIPEFSAEGKQKAARLARRTASDKDAHRGHVRALAGTAIADAAARIGQVTVSEQLGDKIISAAIAATQARAGVPRSSYGQREVIGEVVREEPMRLAGQLELLARGLLALRIPEADATGLVRRCALDSIDQTRRRALAELVTGEVLSAYSLAKRLGCDWHVASRALGDLELIGLVGEVQAAAEGRRGEREARGYRLCGEYAPFVIEAFS